MLCNYDELGPSEMESAIRGITRAPNGKTGTVAGELFDSEALSLLRNVLKVRVSQL